jgi:hypothetical protein
MTPVRSVTNVGAPGLDFETWETTGLTQPISDPGEEMHA